MKICSQYSRGGATANEGCASEHPLSESYIVPTRQINDIFNIYLGLHTLEYYRSWLNGKMSVESAKRKVEGLILGPLQVFLNIFISQNSHQGVLFKIMHTLYKMAGSATG